MKCLLQVENKKNCDKIYIKLSYILFKIKFIIFILYIQDKYLDTSLLGCAEV